MQEDKNKKYLLRKVSGSRKHKHSGYYDYDRNEEKGDFYDEKVEEKFSKISSLNHKTRNRIDYSLVKKWLYSQVGRHHDEIYSDFLERLQPKYKEEHKMCFYYFVAKADITIIEDGVIFTRNNYTQSYVKITDSFYFHPETNILCVVNPPKKKTVSHKEGKIKYAEYKKSSKKSSKHTKDFYKEKSEEGLKVMIEKKRNSKRDN